MKYLAVLLLIFGAGAEEAKLYIQMGHAGYPNSAAFSPDGRYVVTGSGDQTARLWDVANETELRLFQGHFAAVTSVAYSPDGRFVLTGSLDRTARLWDAANGAELRRFGRENLVLSVAFSPDGRYVLAGGDDAAQLWDTTTGALVRQFQGHSRSIRSVAFSHDGRFVLTGSEDKTARLWDTATGTEIRRFQGHTGEVTAVAFSSDGRFVGTASSDHTARLWDAASGAELHQFGHTSRLDSVAFSPDSRFLLSGSFDRTARLWDTASGAEIRQFRHSGEVFWVGFSPDGRYILTVSRDTATRLWDAATGAEVHQLRGHHSLISSLSISTDGRFLLAGSWDKTARLWDMSNGAAIRQLQGHTDQVSAVAFSPDAQLALTGSGDRSARLWNIATGAELRAFRGEPERPKSGITTVDFSSDGRFVVTGSQDHTARLWDSATGAEIRRFRGHTDELTSAAVSPDGRFVLTGSEDRTARLWDASSGAEIHQLSGHSEWVNCVAFSRDSRFALTGGSDALARMWDTASGAEIRQFQGHTSWVTSVAFSADGRLVLTASWDKTARLWDAATGKELRQFQGHLSQVDAAVLSPDSRFVLTGGSDGTVRLWQASTGKWLATLVSFTDGGWAVVDSEGRYDASDPDNSPGLHFVAGYDIIELRQLKRRFYSPGLLAKIWRGEDLDPVAAGLRDVKLVPAIQLVPPAPGSSQATVRLRNRAGGLGRLTVKVNGREVPIQVRGDSAYKTDDASAEIRLDLSGATLSPTGNNVIEVAAYNGEGSIESRGIVANWTNKPAADSDPPAIFAIVVGASQFGDDRMNLRYSAKDAIDMGNALRLAALGLYNNAARVHITVLASGTVLEPSKENIRAAFDTVARQSRAQDLLIAYFAGHGKAAHTERDQYYYFTKEARSADVESDAALRSATTVSSSELREWLDRRNMPLKQVVVLDTCAAGAAFNDVVKMADRRDLSPDQIRAIEFLKDSTGSWILMGSAADSVSYEANRYAQGLLTYALLQGMRGAALDGDHVEVARLFAFAQRQVEDLARGIGGIQRPILSAPKGQTFPIGMLTEKDREQIHLARLKPELLRARVHDEDDLDPLTLEPALRLELREASLPVIRGAARSEPAVVYLDQVVDEVPGALIPLLRYTLKGDRVQVRLRLLRDGKPVAERNLELQGSDPAALSKQLVSAVIAESEKIE